ncbi:MAG: PAS domain-containing protein, partial [Deferribacterales bacterium]
IDIIWVDNYLESTEKILSKEVDAALVGKSFAFTLKDKPVSISNVSVQPVQVHFAYKKGLDIDIVKRIDNGLKELLYDKDSYYYNRLFYMYESGYRYSKMKLFLSTYYKYLIASILIIFALMFIYNRLLKREVGRKTKELRKTIDSLKMFEGKLSSIINSIPGIIFIVDEDFRFIDVLTSNDDKLLAPKSVVIGKRVDDFFTPQKAEFFKSHIVDVFKYKDKVTFIYDIVLKDEIRYFEATCVPLEISNSIYVVVHVNEITTYVNMTNAYKNLSMDLSVEKDKLNRILNAIQEMIIVFNMDGDIIFANHQFKKFFNLQNILSLKIYRLDNDTEISMDIDQLIRGSIGVKKVLKDCYLKVDSSRMLINGSIDIIYDSESKISALVLILWDITRDKMIEDEMIKADKLEALGRIAAGIAHDFNNYLGGLQNYINVLSMSECEDVKSIIPSINVVLRRSRDLTKQLLTF